MDEPCGPVLLAQALVSAGVTMVVVGGTARWLRGSRVEPRDLDVVVEPAAVPALVDALAALGVTARSRSILRASPNRYITPFGPLDVFVALAFGPPPRVGMMALGQVLVAVEA